MTNLAPLVAVLMATGFGSAADSTAARPAASASSHAPLDSHARVSLDGRLLLPALRDTIGGDVAGVEDSLVCRVEAYCPHIWPSDRPRFRVRVANHSSRAILLVTPPWLCSTRRFPRVTSRTEASSGPPLDWEWGCQDLEGQKMEAEDFIAVKPGKQVDLFASYGYQEPGWRETRPGTYVEHFTYSTEDNNLRDWLGEFQPDSLDAVWRARFRRVPRVELHAECTIDVQQP